jgi:hypothetical protein
MAKQNVETREPLWSDAWYDAQSPEFIRQLCKDFHQENTKLIEQMNVIREVAGCDCY